MKKENKISVILFLMLGLSFLVNLIFMYSSLFPKEMQVEEPFNPPTYVTSKVLVNSGFTEEPVDMPVLSKKISENERVRYGVKYFQDSRFETLLRRGNGIRDLNWVELLEKNRAVSYTYEVDFDSEMDSLRLVGFLNDYSVKIVSCISHRNYNGFEEMSFFAMYTESLKVFNCQVVKEGEGTQLSAFLRYE
jgi:hypothetical protein